MREDRSTTERDAGSYARAISNEYTHEPDIEGVFEYPTREFDLDRFERETQAVYASEWYRKNITTQP